MPSDERARCGYAESLWQRGRMREGHLAHGKRLLGCLGTIPERLVRLGQMYLARGDLAGAARQADVAIAANPQLLQHGTAWPGAAGEGNRSEALELPPRA